MAWIAVQGPRSWCYLLLNGFKCLFCISIVLMQAFHGCECVIQVTTNPCDQYIIPLYLFHEQCVKRFIPFNWNRVLKHFSRDGTWDPESQLLDFATEEFINLRIASICFNRCERRLSRSLNDKLVAICTVHQIWSYICRSFNRSRGMQAEDFCMVLKGKCIPNMVPHCDQILASDRHFIASNSLVRVLHCKCPIAHVVLRS